jgi:hypothetical protein
MVKHQTDSSWSRVMGEGHISSNGVCIFTFLATCNKKIQPSQLGRIRSGDILLTPDFILAVKYEVSCQYYMFS